MEILPFEQANFRAIEDFEHFARLAKRYWNSDAYPNYVLPELAPFCPQIHVQPTGAIRVRSENRYMVALLRSSRFMFSERYLRLPTLPQELFEAVREPLLAQGWQLPATPEQGRLQALEACRDYRRKRWYADPRQTARLLAQVRQVNRVLSQSNSSANNGTSLAER